MRDGCLSRCFADPARWRGSGEILLDPEESRHLCRVLQARPGDAVEVFDGTGRRATARVESVGAESRLRVDAVTVDPPASRELRLVVGLPRGMKLDWLLQKSVELGLSRLTLFGADRSVARLDDRTAARRAERWARIARDAAKQSGGGRLPVLAWRRSLGAVLDDPPAPAEIRLACSLSAPPGSLPGSFRRGLREGRRTWTFFIGPEGDFSPAERDALRRAGAVEISLGPRILRVETAAVVALSAAWYAFEARGADD